MLQFNGFLKEKLIREVQITKTGFAICLFSLAAQETLFSRKSELESFLLTKGDCKVEKPTNHLACLLIGITPLYAGYNGNSIEGVTITVPLISEALRDISDIAPINIIECKYPNMSEHIYNKNWVALYPEGFLLPKMIPLFGVHVQTKLLPKSSKTVGLTTLPKTT